MGLHPTVATLSDLVQMQKVPQLPSMSAALGPLQSAWSLASLEVVECLQPDPDWDPVVVVRHGSASHVLWQQLVGQLAVGLAPQDVGEVVELVGSCIHELVHIDELWHGGSVSLLESMLCHEFSVVNLISILLLVPHLHGLADFWLLLLLLA